MLIDFKQLWPKHGIFPKGVLHIGANVGEEAPTYHTMGVSNVVWIEGNNDIHNTLARNISIYPGQKSYCYLLGDKDEDSVLHISNNGSQSSSVLELGTHKTAHPEVHYIEHRPLKMYRLDSLNLPISECDFLNIDVQGAELMVLKGMGDLLNQFKWAYLEVNQQPLYQGCALIGEVDAYMAKFGFKRVETKWVRDKGWGDGCFIKK